MDKLQENSKTQPLNEYQTQPFEETEEQGPGCLSQGINIILSPVNFLISKIGCGCKSLVGLGCVIPLVFFVLLILMILFQPSPVWEPFKSFLNQDLSSDDFSQLNASSQSDSQTDSELASQPDSQAEEPEASTDNASPDQNSIEITEAQLAQALSQNYPVLENFYLDISPDKLRLLTNIEDEGGPLWVYIDIKYEESADNEQEPSKFNFDRAGFGLFELPPGLINLANQKLNEALDTFNLDSVNEILPLEKPQFDETQNHTIELQENKIVLKSQKNT